MVAAVARSHPLLERARVTSNDLLEFPSVGFDTSLSRSTGGNGVVTGIPSLDSQSRISTAQFTDAVFLSFRSPIVAKVPASLVEWLREFLPLVAVELSGEETGIDEAMFWASVQEELLLSPVFAIYPSRKFLPSRLSVFLEALAA
jgi:hypothetical protein